MDSQDQKIRSEMRIQFLKSLDFFSDQNCAITMHGGFESKGKMLSTDRDFHHVCVENFPTPTGTTVQYGKVRLTDIEKISVQRNNISR